MPGAAGSGGEKAWGARVPSEPPVRLTRRCGPRRGRPAQSAVLDTPLAAAWCRSILAERWQRAVVGTLQLSGSPPTAAASRGDRDFRCTHGQFPPEHSTFHLLMLGCPLSDI